MLTEFNASFETEDAIYKVKATVRDKYLEVSDIRRSPIWRGRRLDSQRPRTERFYLELDSSVDFPPEFRASMTYWPELLDGVFDGKLPYDEIVKEAWWTQPELRGWDAVEPDDGFKW